MKTINELAILISKSEKTIRRWIKDGLIQAVPLGRAYGISDTEIDRILNSGVELRKECKLTLPKNNPARHNPKGIRPWEK